MKMAGLFHFQESAEPHWLRLVWLNAEAFLQQLVGYLFEIVRAGRNRFVEAIQLGYARFCQGCGN